MNKKCALLIALICLILLPPLSGYAFTGAYYLGHDEEVFGIARYHVVRSDDEILTYKAIDYDIGYNELVDANPEIDPWYPGKGKKALIPTFWVLPEYPEDILKRHGQLIVINLAEMRLFYIKEKDHKKIVLTFPIGIGSEGFDTPTGVFTIIEKKENPTWIVPKSIREKDPTLPERVPPGPDNPLGEYALRLSNPSYLIHGTNKPLGIGRRVSHGCIRLYPEDIKVLYNLTKVGTPVYITYQPVKIGKKAGRYYLEYHRGYKKLNPLQEAIGIFRSKKLPFPDTALLYKAIRQSRGVPVELSLPEGGPHDLQGGLLAGPDTKGIHGLPEQHP